MYHFSDDYNVDRSDILNIHKYLMVNNNIKQCWLIKQVFIALMNFSVYLATKCKSLNNEPWIIRTTVFYLTPIELH